MKRSPVAVCLALACLAAAGGLGIGCGRRAEPPEPIAAAGLPDDPLTLLYAARTSYRPLGPVESVERSLAAAEKLAGQQPDSRMAHLLAARAALWLVQFGDLDEATARRLAGDGLVYAEAALEAGPEDGEALFLAGALRGLTLKLGHSPGLVAMRRVHDELARAAELAPELDEGSPLRALGSLLVLAPPWPAGVGDGEAGLELLHQAVERFPDHPANRLCLADAQAAEGMEALAEREYRRVLEITREGAWGVPGEHWAAQAEAALGR